LDHPDELIALTANLFEVLLGQLIPPALEVLPDLRPLLGKRLWGFLPNPPMGSIPEIL